jgi:hypothetical protein
MSEIEKGYQCRSCGIVYQQDADECGCGMPRLIPVKLKALGNDQYEVIGPWEDEPAVKPDLEDEMLDKMVEQVEEILEVPAEKMKVKLGQRFKWKEERQTETLFQEAKKMIKPGDILA